MTPIDLNIRTFNWAGGGKVIFVVQNHDLVDIVPQEGQTVVPGELSGTFKQFAKVQQRNNPKVLVASHGGKFTIAPKTYTGAESWEQHVTIIHGDLGTYTSMKVTGDNNQKLRQVDRAPIGQTDIHRNK